MHSLIYFIPHIKSLKQETLNEYGLKHILKGGISVAETTKAIDNHPGFLFQHSNTETKIGYRPDTQTWVKMLVDNNKYIYIGYDNELNIKPKLNTLIKKNIELNSFFEIKLNDGNTYKIPRAQYIPQSFEFAPDGTIVAGLSEKYKDIIDIADKYYKKFNAGFKELDEEGNMNMIIDELSIMKDMCHLLSYYYKVSFLECVLFKLFDSNNMVVALKMFLGYDQIEEIEKEEKELIELEKKTVCI